MKISTMITGVMITNATLTLLAFFALLQIEDIKIILEKPFLFFFVAFVIVFCTGYVPAKMLLSYLAKHHRAVDEDL